MAIDTTKPTDDDLVSVHAAYIREMRSSWMGDDLSDTGEDVPWFLDEDDMVSDDDTKVPSQASVKAYVDDLRAFLIANYTANGATSLTGKSWFLHDNTLGANDATKVPSQASVKYYVDHNTISTGTTDLTGFGFFLDEDDMASDDDTKVPSQQSVKAYVDNAIGGLLPVVNEAMLSFTDILTANSTALRHGLLPKLSGNAGQYLTGAGTWVAPPGGGNVTAPAVNTDNFFPQWDGNNTVLLKNGYGAGSAATASTLILRDAAGRARVADPDNDGDIATKKYVDDSIVAGGDVSGPGVSVIGYVPIWNNILGTLLGGGYEVTADADANTIPLRDASGNFKVGSAVFGTDAVNITKANGLINTALGNKTHASLIDVTATPASVNLSVANGYAIASLQSDPLGHITAATRKNLATDTALIAAFKAIYASVASQTGYIHFNSGIVLAWKTVSVTNGTNATTDTLPGPVPYVNVYGIFPTVLVDSGSNVSCHRRTNTTSSVTFYTSDSGVSGRQIAYLVVGYKNI